MAAKRLTGEYAGSNKDDVYAEIQARRADREGKEGENTFNGINSGNSKEEMVAALDDDDKQAPAQAHGSGKSTERAGVGKEEEGENIPIPDEVKFKAHGDVPSPGTKTTTGPTVTGDQSQMIMDIRQGTPVEVWLIEATPYRKDLDPTLVFIQGTVSSETLPYKNALAKFACRPDGTVIYNALGFDDVPADKQFNMVDIKKLAEHNQGSAEPKKTEAGKK